jgi:hypothetical protein
MKKNIILSTLFFLGVALLTNPGVEAHRSASVETFSQVSNPEDGLLAEMGFKFLLERYADARITSTSYLFFSTTNFIRDDGSKKTFGVGAFGFVKILVNADEIKNQQNDK